MSLLGRKIVVLGGGIGGLTAAIALAQRGAMVTVLEQAEALKEVGAGIQISPNGGVVLSALGLGTALEARSVTATAVELLDYRKERLITRLDLQKRAAKHPYLFVHRADLIDILSQAARSADVKVRLLQKGISVTPGKRPVVHLSNGDQVSADVVIAADGLHSVARPALNGTLAPFFTRQVAWRAIVPNVTAQPNVARLYMGPKRHLVCYPLRGGEQLNLVAVEERGAWAEEGWSHRDTPRNLQAAFADFGPNVQRLLAEVTDVGLWGLFRHLVAPIWAKGGVALLGDAAHPTLPFMAQGAVMAIEDAWVLADSLAGAEDIDAGLALYQSRREERVRKIVDTASGNARKYHLSWPPLRFAAHTGMRLAGAVAPGALMAQFDWIYHHDVTQSD